jgi:alkyl hydroperoxide reductase subunit AhpC
VARAYGVFDDTRGFAVRGSFLVDAEGVLRWSLVNPPGRARDFGSYRAALADLAA